MNATDLVFIENALAADNDLRDKLRETSQTLEKHLRIMTATLNRIHSTPQSEQTALLLKLEPELEEYRKASASIAAVVPEHQYWRWKDLWSRHAQNAVFVVTLRHYLQNGDLLPIANTSEILGYQSDWQDRFYLSAEEYLQGIISMVDELGRLAVNLVTMGDFDGPLKISAFVKEVFSAFSILNLKNDNLRRKFDSLKYILKKLEEIVYDLSLRKLVNRTGSSS
ncbi:Translin [Auriculariales sp. MPI-PUGE-AT-0066]|nr:Translin [Auriculariales sp. MPI-PUGE-AT-0066]